MITIDQINSMTDEQVADLNKTLSIKLAKKFLVRATVVTVAVVAANAYSRRLLNAMETENAA